MNASFNEIEKEYSKINMSIQKTKGSSGGGFFDKSVEKKYQRAISTWNTYYIKNKTNSANVAFINKCTFETGGDCRKNKEFNISLNTSMDYFNKIIKDSSGNKNISKNSYITLFTDVVEALDNPKLLKMYKLAYSDYKTNKNQNSISSIVIMCHQIMASFVYFGIGAINADCITNYTKMNLDNKDLKLFENFLNDNQNKNRSIICNLGYPALEIAKTLLAIKDPENELKNAIKTQKEGNEKIAKAKESFDSAVTQPLYYELSNESYLVDKSNEFGSEEALTVALIVIASVIGLIALIAGIRRAVYVFGTLKTDISEYIKVDVVTVSMNIEMLKQKLENTTDKKERKRIQSIIDKQQKFVDKFASTVQNANDDAEQGGYEATYTIEDEDKQDSSDGSQDSSSSDGYDILI